MKRFWATLPVAGVVLAFGISAFAAPFDAGEQNFARGSYFSNPSFSDSDQGPNRGGAAASSSDGRQRGLGAFGTDFFNKGNTNRTGFRYILPFGPRSLVAAVQKKAVGDAGGNNPSQLQQPEADYNIYDFSLAYKFPGGDAGLRIESHRDAGGRAKSLPIAARFARDMHLTNAYFRTMLGPVALRGEALMIDRKRKPYYDAAASAFSRQNQTSQALAMHLDARMDLGPAYVGGRFFYAAGDDGVPEKKKGGLNLEGEASPGIFGAFTSLLFNEDERGYFQTQGNIAEAKKNDNAQLYQLYGGYTPTQKIDLVARLSYGEADKAAAGHNKSYGTEIDVRGTYKVSDNLTYNIGAAYLWTGDYFKGNAPSNTSNTYHLLHWLNLNF